MTLLTLFTAFLSLAAVSHAFPFPTPMLPEVIRQNDDLMDTYTCPNIDHYFYHQKFWIAASSTSNCMTLETDPDIVHKLNQISSPRPDGFKQSFSLVCSLERETCSWKYNPLDKIDTDDDNVEEHVILPRM